METAFWVKWRLPDHIWTSNLVYRASFMLSHHKSKSFFFISPRDIYSIFFSFPVKPSDYFFPLQTLPSIFPFIPLFFTPLRPIHTIHTASKVLKSQRWLIWKERSVGFNFACKCLKVKSRASHYWKWYSIMSSRFSSSHTHTHTQSHRTLLHTKGSNKQRTPQEERSENKTKR